MQSFGASHRTRPHEAGPEACPDRHSPENLPGLQVAEQLLAELRQERAQLRGGGHRLVQGVQYLVSALAIFEDLFHALQHLQQGGEQGVSTRFEGSRAGRGVLLAAQRRSDPCTRLEEELAPRMLGHEAQHLREAQLRAHSRGRR